MNPDVQDVEKSSSLLLFNLFPEFFPTWQTEANFDPELFLPQVVSHMLNVLPNSVGLALERKENVFFTFVSVERKRANIIHKAFAGIC